MGGLLAQPQTLLADVQDQLGQPLLPDTAYDALDVHLTEAEMVDRAALLVHVKPPPGEVVVHSGRKLNKQTQ